MATTPKSIEGVYRDGKVELCETPPDVEDARVIVTFLAEDSVDLQNGVLLLSFRQTISIPTPSKNGSEANARPEQLIRSFKQLSFKTKNCRRKRCSHPYAARSRQRRHPHKMPCLCSRLCAE
jgi:hypothetical protein